MKQVKTTSYTYAHIMAILQPGICNNKGDQTLSLPFSSPYAVPDLDWYQFPPGVEFTVAPRVDTPLPPTDNASPIGPVGTVMQLS